MNRHNLPPVSDLSEADLAAMSDEKIADLLDTDDGGDGEPWTEETLKAAILKGIASAEAGHVRAFDAQAVEDILSRASTMKRSRQFGNSKK